MISYHIWAWQSSWLCDQDHKLLNKLSFPYPKESLFGIWDQLAQWSEERGCLKMLTRLMDERQHTIDAGVIGRLYLAYNKPTAQMSLDMLKTFVPTTGVNGEWNDKIFACTLVYISFHLICVQHDHILKKLIFGPSPTHCPLRTQAFKLKSCLISSIYELRHVISNNVAFWQVWIQTSLCSLLLSLETPNDVQSVA